MSFLPVVQFFCLLIDESTTTTTECFAKSLHILRHLFDGCSAAKLLP